MITLKEAFRHYLRAIQVTHSEQVQTLYGQSLRLFESILQHDLKIKSSKANVAHFSSDWLQAYLIFLQTNRSIETEHLYIRAILGFLSHAQNQRWIEINVQQLDKLITDQRRPKQHNTPLPPIQAISDLLNYMKSVPIPSKDDATQRERLQVYRDKAFIQMLAETGMRISEFCELRRYQINLDKQLLIISPQNTFHLSKATVLAVQSYLNERNELDKTQALLSPEHLTLFARHDKRAGKRILPISRWTGANIISHWLNQAFPHNYLKELEENNQQITPHSFRHYFVLTTLKRTGNLEETQSLARHLDMSTTRRYLQHLPDSDQKQKREES